MADISDVETALVAAATSVLVPAGSGGKSMVGSGARVYRGWPMTAALDADLLLGVVNVSVSSVPGATNNTTRWGVQTWVAATAPGITVSVLGNSAVLAGVPNPGDLAGLLVAGVAYVYQARAGDSAELVAATLADQVRQNQICWLSGVTVTVPGVPSIVARTVALQPSTAEWARQEQGFRVSIWAPTPALRDAACSAVCSLFATVAFLPLADGTGGRLRYRNTASFDDGQDAGVYRRDLVYDVEYATTSTSLLPSMLFGELVYNGVTSYA